jgi:hypothetical protein
VVEQFVAPIGTCQSKYQEYYEKESVDPVVLQKSFLFAFKY